jgi:SPP1 family predicted phage head-tail adaptor
MALEAGTLNRKIVIQRMGDEVDEVGQPIPNPDWIDVASPWASIRHLAGLEAVRAGAESSLVRASIRIRYRLGINSGMRVKYGSSLYNINAVLPDATNREYCDLVCEMAQ